MPPATLLVALSLLPLSAAGVVAQADIPSTTPEFAIVGKVDPTAGTVELKFAFHVLRTMEEERQKIVDGKPVKYKAMAQVLQLRVETEVMPLGEILVVDIAGKKIEKDAVFQRLKPGQAVLVNSSDQALAPAIAKQVAADTLVFVSPPEEAEGPPPGPAPLGPPAR